MKFPIFDKFSKYGTLALTLVAWVILIVLIVVTSLHNVNLWNELVEAGIWLAIFAAIILTLMITYPIFWVFCVCSHVVVDEAGVKLSLGRLTLNQIKWQEIKRIEIFEDRSGRGYTGTFVNILRVNQETKMSKNHTMAPNWTRKRITFLYNQDALPLLQQYCQCQIHGLLFAEKYNKQSTNR